MSDIDFGHPPVYAPLPRCGACGRSLKADPTDPTGWRHIPSFHDTTRAFREANRREATERATAAEAYTGPETDCQAKVYQSMGLSFTYTPCSKRATKVREGHPVCGSHARARDVAWRA